MLVLQRFSGLVHVTGETHTRRSHQITIPARTVKMYKPPLKGKVVPRWVEKTTEAKTKDVTEKHVEYHSVQFTANEATCTDTRVGAAFDLACRMFEDGCKNVRIWDYNGNELVITAKDVKQRDKALGKAMKFVANNQDDIRLLAA